MNSRKMVGGLCLMVMVLSSIAWPGQAFGVNGNELLLLAQREPFDHQLLISDVSNRELPPGRSLDEDNFFAEREPLGYLYPEGETLSFEIPPGRTLDQKSISLQEEIRSTRQWEPRGEQVQPFEFFLPDLPESGVSNRGAVTCTVTSKADSGAGTLRSCLTSLAAGDVILFDPTVFPPVSPQTIYLTSELPGILHNNVTVDASNAGVIVDGSALESGSAGLVIWGAQGSKIMGLQITNFIFGVVIGNGGTDNVIGGDRAIGAGPMGQGNRISGNSNVGVLMQNTGTSQNAIRGNLIGTNLSGDGAVGNGYAGIVIGLGASHNVIGGNRSPGACDGSCNLISGNSHHGVYLEGPGASDNTISGNFIGTDFSGDEVVGNGYGGVVIVVGASQNMIGGDHSPGVCDGPCNLIGGNQVGIQIEGADSQGNQVKGNFIGTNLRGSSANPNTHTGLIIWGASGNSIGGARNTDTCDGPCNLISGNTYNGVMIEGEGASYNTVGGNFIGTDFSGDEAVGNGHIGVAIIDDASQNVIGGDHSPGMCDGPCNLISGNQVGIQIEGANTQGNQVRGNFIGTNLQGSSANPNTYIGLIVLGATGNFIGGARNTGACDGPCNLISGNTYDGVLIEGEGASHNTVSGNFIGTNYIGDGPIGNGDSGIWVSAGASQNVIGGEHSLDACDKACNLISGNSWSGVCLEGAGTSYNTIGGNFIGTNLSGNAAVSNDLFGIFIGFGASNNVIGGNNTEMRNLISGNSESGVWLQNVGTFHNKISGNFIGTDISGADSLGSQRKGVNIGWGAAENLVGGARPTSVCDGPSNLISGHIEEGIVILDIGSDGNNVLGNFIGTNATGASPLPNNNGLVIAASAKNNQVGGTGPGEGNLISGNTNYGIWFGNEDTTDNQVLGNRIGTDITGFTALPNYIGILFASSPGNQVGGVDPGAGNLISGNDSAGIVVYDATSAATGTTIAGNKIGTNMSGTTALPNFYGIQLLGGGANLVGGAPPGAGNLISGNTLYGIYIELSSENRVQGNTVGADQSGSASIPNWTGVFIGFGASNNLIGGGIPGMGNQISGNAWNGITIQDENSIGNLVLGNRIGTNSSGASALPNDVGVVVIGARETTIGGADLGTPWTCDGLCNLISGNASFGILIQGVGAGGSEPPGTVNMGSLVLGNFIGTDFSGDRALPNMNGVALFDQAGGNRVGGNSLAGEGNLISGNLVHGVNIANIWTEDNQVSGNRIGTTVNGNAALSNGNMGIFMYKGASNNLIGGDQAGMGNLISGNNSNGIGLSDEGTNQNQIINNRIGTNASGTNAVPNIAGVGLVSQVSGTNIRGNLISGNFDWGLILLESANNEISDNQIGVAADGLSPLPNGDLGLILLSAPHNTIGPGNTIAHHLYYGVSIVEPESIGNTITRNSIYANKIKQIGFFEVPVPLAPTPLLIGWNEMTNTVMGTACGGCQVEVFANPTATRAGHTYLGTATAGGDGSFSLTVGEGHNHLASTATDAEGTTSEFSNSLQIGEDTHMVYLPLILK